MTVVSDTNILSSLAAADTIEALRADVEHIITRMGRSNGSR